MKILRTEEGRFTRTIELEVDKEIVEIINHNLSMAITNGAKFNPLTLEDVCNILTYSIEAPRFNEEYFVDYDFYTGNIKLGNFVRSEINNIFADLPGEVNEETEVWYDEFYP